MNEPDRLCSNCRFWARRLQDPTPDQPLLGECRRYPPACGAGLAAAAPTMVSTGTACATRTGWPLVLDRDWCGEWNSMTTPLPDEALNEEEDRQLRNSAIAQAILVLSPEKRDALLCAVLADEERLCPTPPDDFYQRVQEYLARPGEGTAT